MTDNADLQCGVCGKTAFSSYEVLWEGLIREWQLGPEEADYINRQQATVCDTCRSNIRTIAMANALRAFMGTEKFLNEAVIADEFSHLKVLEINAAGNLTKFLQRLSGHVFAPYPQVDIHALPYEADHFDIVVHSDTLEHVENPVHGLTECRRVLKPGGALCFTVPLIIDRMTRSRDGLPKSYHGGSAGVTDDVLVRTEFGADAWRFIVDAGFSEIALHTVDFPAGIAFLAYKR